MWTLLQTQEDLTLTTSDLTEYLVNTARDSLLTYTQLTYPKYRPNWHHKKIIEYLEKVERREILRLIITIPPRHGKSELSSIRLPAWYLGRNPHKKVILASYSDSFSNSFGKHARNLCQSDIHREIFPESRVRRDSSSGSLWELDRGGKFVAVGRGGSVTGHGAHLLILDDLIKNIQEAYSETIRDTIWDWYKTTLFTRLEDAAAIVIVNTRWHADDIIGRIFELEPGKWTHIKMPAIADCDYCYDDHIFKQGEVLWPEKYALKEILEIKEVLGSHFEPIYQQDPKSETGNIIKRDDWQRKISVPDNPLWIIQSWDTGFKKGEDNSYSACTTWIETENAYFLWHAYWEKLEFPALKRKAVELYEAFKPNEVIIEDKASGQSLIQELQENTKIPLRPIKPTGDKVARAHVVTPVFESKKVYIYDGQKWTDDVIDICAKFPGTKIADIVDSVTQAIEHLRHGHSFKYGYHKANNSITNKKKSIFEMEKEYARHGG